MHTGQCKKLNLLKAMPCVYAAIQLLTSTVYIKEEKKKKKRRRWRTEEQSSIRMYRENN